MTATKRRALSSASQTPLDPLKADFRNFLWAVWRYLELKDSQGNLADPTAVQYDIAHWLQHGPRRLVIEAFRGVGKSWVTSAFVCWLLYCNPQIKILVVSASKQRADDFSTFTLQLIHGFPLLQHLAPGPDQRQSKIAFDVRPAKNTTPESLDLSALIAETGTKGVRAGVMEVSSHALKSCRVEDLTFAAAGFSNLSLEHTEFHPDMEDYYQAKRRLFLVLTPADRGLVIGIDDAWGRRLADECRQAGRNVCTVSVKGTADLYAADIRLSGMATDFTLVADGVKRPCRIALAGEFNVFNALMAAGLTRCLGIGWDTILGGITSLATVPGRFESIANDRGVTVIVDYAHSPAALENLLHAVRPLAANGRVISVFGCGGNRSTEKRPVMGRLSATMADITVVTSDNPRNENPNDIISQIISGIDAVPSARRREVHVEADRRKAIALAISIARAGDVLLIAGKGHETGQIFADRTVPFDDRIVAKELLEGAHG